MSIFDLFRTKSKPVTETKSFSGPLVGFPEFLQSNGEFGLGAFASMVIYTEAMPLFNAIDTRATAFSQIPMRLWDKKKKEYVEDHPVFELLNNPNADLTGEEFLYAYSSYFDITGNSFLMATGRIQRPPLEIMTIKPSDVTFGFGSKFGFLNIPDTIRFDEAAIGQISFKAEEDKNSKKVRFINSFGDKEAFHTRQFSPSRSTSNFFGLSKAKPLWYELQQFISGNKTNLSMLKRGTRLSMAWTNTTGEELTETQWDRLQEMAQKYSGDLNAGGTPVLDGVGVETIQQTNRDMEFNTMQDTMESRVNKVYKIPLAKTTIGAMTLNNLETAQLQLYDDAVLPLAKYLYADLSIFLLPRYPNSENLEFKFNEHDITALKVRIINSAKEQNEINVNTVNEIRAVLGYEPLASGGDAIMFPANLIPSGQDGFTEDQPKTPTATKYVKYMRKLKNADGSRRYTDIQIDKELSDRHL